MNDIERVFIAVQDRWGGIRAWDVDAQKLFQVRALKGAGDV